MTLAKFTRKEIETMRDTWREVEHLLERSGSWGRARRDWQAALKLETKECGSREWAYSLILREFWGGWQEPRSLADAYEIREGARLAHLLGAHLGAWCQRNPHRLGDAGQLAMLADALKGCEAIRKRAETARLDAIQAAPSP